MGDSEAKARKKLEEAEKKAKGGGGFLGSFFGGGKAEEAADLFVQVFSIYLLNNAKITIRMFTLFIGSSESSSLKGSA